MTLDLRERVLYHQIHPLKLIVDWTTALGAAALFWQHRAAYAFALGFIPSIIASAALISWADLARYRDSAFGRYVRHFMTRRVEAARFLGLIPLWGGAWRHAPLAMLAGVAWIVGCWLWGLRPKSSPRGAV